MNMLRLFTRLQRLTPLAVFSLLLLAAGCNQDSIFDYISGETAPTKAKIKGSPSKIVSVKKDGVEKLYLANGRLWEYASAVANSSWSRVAGPGGYVADVASTSDTLYALTLDNTSARVWERQNDGTWETVNPPSNGYGFIQNIFGAGDTLFATGAQRSGDDYDYTILYYKKTATMFSVLGNTDGALLAGAGKVGSTDYYYLAAWGKGIYKASVSAGTISLEGSAPFGPTDVAGLLQADSDLIIGISKGGRILFIDASGIDSKDTTLGGGAYSGALALMKNPEPHDDFEKLLLLGTETRSSYTHGYVELRFKNKDTYQGPQHPGQNQPSSIKDNGSIKAYQQYESSLRRYPVTALWVLEPTTEEKPKVIFAATSNQGLYSYRSRSGEWQWNREE
jgi:hypothetical protein